MKTTTDTRPLVERITQGPYEILDTYQGMLTDKWKGMPHKVSSPTFDICLMFGDGINNKGVTAANTELIADAFNTAHRTRRTPSELASERQELLDALRELLERAEAVAEGIPVDKRHAGVSPATHVAHMAGHLAQHCKPARQLYDRLTEAPARRLTEEEIHSQAMTAAFGDHMQG